MCAETPPRVARVSLGAGWARSLGGGRPAASQECQEPGVGSGSAYAMAHLHCAHHSFSTSTNFFICAPSPSLPNLPLTSYPHRPHSFPFSSTDHLPIRALFSPCSPVTLPLFLTYPRIPPRIHPRTETKHADDPRPDESLFAVAPRQRLRCPDAEQRGPPTTHPPSSRRKQVTKHRGRLRRQIVSVFNACPNFSHLNQQSNAQWLCGFADFMNRT